MGGMVLAVLISLIVMAVTFVIGAAYGEDRCVQKREREAREVNEANRMNDLSGGLWTLREIEIPALMARIKAIEEQEKARKR